MATEAILECKSVAPDAASALLQAFTDASWRQMPAYCTAAAAQIGAVSEYLAVFEGDRLIGLANVRFKKLPVIPGGIALISHGPMTVAPGDSFDELRYAKVVDALKHEVVVRRKFCLRIDPALTSVEVAALQARSLARSAFSGEGGRKYQTFMLDLAKGEEQLRADLNGKWRTDLRRGEKQGLTIKRSSDAEAFAEFAPLLDELSRAKDFAPPQGANFFAQVAAQAGTPENITIHNAYADGELVAGHIGAFAGDKAVYLLGATSNRGRELRASYVLQWEVIRYAIELGLSQYDLGGADEDENPSVFRFKKRMGGELVLNLPMHELWPSPLIRLATLTAEKAYKALAGFK